MQEAAPPLDLAAICGIMTRIEVMHMNAEVITIGTELLLGEIVDTNATHIARELRTIGLDLYYKTTVGDNETRCAAVLDRALDRADVVLTTGGLGPTVDDITREAVARATGRSLEFRQDLLRQIQERFDRWGATMSDNNRRQAFVPQGAIPIENPVGTAPCFIVDTERGVVISLPGVPREMEYLLAHEVLPYLRSRFDLVSVIQTRILRTAGMGESQIDAVLRDMLTAANPSIGLSAHPGQTDVRITAKAESEEAANQLIAPVETEVRHRLGRAIYGTGDDTVEQAALAHLKRAGYSLVAAESGTGGLLTNRLSTAAGTETAFLRGYVSNDPSALGRTLGIVSESSVDDSLEAFAGLLARRLIELGSESRDDRRLALVVLTLSRLGEDAATSAGGTVIALGTPNEVTTRLLGFGGHASHVAIWATTHALEFMRRWLLDHLD
jgi:nicotinamide-nucleotide amidase